MSPLHPAPQRPRRIRSLTPERVAKSIAWRTRHLQPNLRAVTRWRGEKPRIYLHNAPPHPIFRTYLTHPTLRYAPYPVAELCHWVDELPQLRFLRKPHVFEVEHLVVLAKADNRRFMEDWYRIFDDNDFLNRLIAREQCRRVFTFSAGLVEHSKGFLHADLWHKLDYVYPAYPSQSEYRRPVGEPFTILVIASRFSDKGVPEALRAYGILRERHGAAVRMILVSQVVPPDYPLPEGVIHHDTPRMSEGLKAHLYRSSDVLFIPCYSETAACFTEASAFGVPVITTRIHHGDEFVRDGVTGYLLAAPVFIYSADFGRRWRTAEDFLNDLAAMRERGELDMVVEQAVERLEAMISGGVDLEAMRRAARRFHAERFSPEVRNQRLRQLYAAALECE